MKHYEYCTEWKNILDDSIPESVKQLFTEIDQNKHLLASEMWDNTDKYPQLHRHFDTFIYNDELYIFGGVYYNIMIYEIFVTDYKESRVPNSWRVIDKLPEDINNKLRCPCCHRTRMYLR